jgi:hypothetical protein
VVFRAVLLLAVVGFQTYHQGSHRDEAEGDLPPPHASTITSLNTISTCSKTIRITARVHTMVIRRTCPMAQHHAVEEDRHVRIDGLVRLVLPVATLLHQ